MSVIGTELKIRINVQPIDGVHLSECDFTCSFYVTPSKIVTFSKEELIMLDNDTYLALINSEELGVGAIKMNIKILVPDDDFPNKVRTEIDTVNTGITIRNK